MSDPDAHTKQKKRSPNEHLAKRTTITRKSPQFTWQNPTWSVHEGTRVINTDRYYYVFYSVYFVPNTVNEGERKDCERVTRAAGGNRRSLEDTASRIIQWISSGEIQQKPKTNSKTTRLLHARDPVAKRAGELCVGSLNYGGSPCFHLSEVDLFWYFSLRTFIRLLISLNPSWQLKLWQRTKQETCQSPQYPYIKVDLGDPYNETSLEMHQNGGKNQTGVENQNAGLPVALRVLVPRHFLCIWSWFLKFMCMHDVGIYSRVRYRVPTQSSWSIKMFSSCDVYSKFIVLGYVKSSKTAINAQNKNKTNLDRFNRALQC